MQANSYDLKIAKTLKALRELRNIKQQQVAKLFDNDCFTYTSIENGE
jgi:transcriptional regulator with XRE-family HTH domain